MKTPAANGPQRRGWAGLGWAGLGWVLASSSSAHAMDWYETELAFDDTAFGASIRNWGPTGDTFVFVNHTEEFSSTDFDHATTLFHYECDAAGGGYEFCENATLIDEEDVGATIHADGPHAMHPASAIRLYSSGEQELTLARNEEEGTYACSAGGDLVWDIVSYVYRTTTGSVVESLPIQRAEKLADCEDHGKSEVKYDGATAHACYTTIDASGDFVQCNEDDGGTSEWSSPEDLPAAHEEDHPTFVIDDDGDRITAVHAFTTGSHSILVRLADGTPVTISDDDDSPKNHPELSSNNGSLRIVYHHDPNENNDFRLAYKGCNATATVDCSDYGYPGDPTDDWLEEYITDDVYGPDHYFQAKHVEHVKDLAAQREFIAFQYNAKTALSGDRLRVVVGTRCFGGSWDFEQPREPDQPNDDQSLIYGTPGLVLDKNHQLVHIAFAELTQMNGNNPDTTAGGDAYWLRASYADLPSCL